MWCSIAERVEPGFEPREVRSTLLVEPVDELRRVLGHTSAFGPLAVKDPERPVELVAVLVAKLVTMLHQIRSQCLDIGRAATGAPHRVDGERHPLEPDRPVQRRREGDHLHVEIGVVRADHLDPHLMMLPVAPGLRLLVTESRCHVPRLPGNHRMVLHEDPYHGRSSLGPQREAAAIPVVKLVHLLAHDLALVTESPVEQARLFEHRREH